MSRGNVRVRPAQQSDVAGLAKVCLDSGLGEQIGVRGRKCDLNTLLERYTSMLQDLDRLVFVAVEEEQNTVVGVLVLAEEQLGLLQSTTVLQVSQLVVTPQQRRRGVGRALLTTAVRHAEDCGVDHLLIGVPAAARDANRHLARLGFAPLVVRRIASVAVLRRSLGIVESVERVALRRRRSVRGVLPGRAIRRGA